MSLPIDAVLPDIEQALANASDVILDAPPGAGKTTRVPLQLLASSAVQGKILMLEPRRVAARAVASRMAALLGEAVGGQVGYRVRHDSQIGRDTRIEVVTGGVLLRLLQTDPGLGAYGLVIFDEFHERGLDADLSLSLVLQGRDLFRGAQCPLKTLIMSATLEGQPLSALLPRAPVIESRGRSYEVAIRYREGFAAGDLVTACHRAVVEALEHHSGHLLVFLPGQREIEALAARLARDLAPDVALRPLYGALSLAEQQRAIDTPPAGQRKIVLATDIAETSLTIEGITAVVDSGYRRTPRFDAKSAMTRLQTTRISQASATQRSGRAGRVAPGCCYRLWRREQPLAQRDPAEIEQADLAPLALQLLAWGANDPSELPWLTPPPEAAYRQAMDLLDRLEAVQQRPQGYALTAHGEQLAAFAAHPRLAHMILKAGELGVGEPACRLAAILHDNPRVLTRDQTLEALLEQPAQWPAAIASDYRRFIRLSGTSARPLAFSDWGLLLALAYPDRIARRRRGSATEYLLANGRAARLAEGDPLQREPWLVVAELSGAGHSKRDRIVTALALDPAAFESDLKGLVEEATTMHWSDKAGRFIAEQQSRCGAITIAATPLERIDPTVKQRALCDYIRQKGLQVLPWREADRQWLGRIRLMRRLQAETASATPEPWPPFDDESLLATLERWLGPFLTAVTTVGDWQSLDLQACLSAQLTWPQNTALDTLAPTHCATPAGSQVAINYLEDPPVWAVKLQEMFGETATPTIAQGRVALKIHLLSPAGRPLQVTQDLGAFWRNAYQHVKKEMKGRYPKHPWPDDPLSAAPTRNTKKRR